MTRPSRIVLTALLTVAGFAGTASAQAVYGSVSGVVTDSTSAVVPGVTVTVTSVERQTTDSVTTNDSGVYVKERLLPGTYEVKAELPGFKAAVFSDIRMPGGMNGVELGRAIRADFPRIGVLLATGFSDAAAGAEAQGFGLITKPYHTHELADALAAVLRAGASGDSSASAAG